MRKQSKTRRALFARNLATFRDAARICFCVLPSS